jgi:hypothetical protein
MKRLLSGALCASLLVLGLIALPMPALSAAPIPVPGVPEGVTVVAGGLQVTVSWSAPTSGPTPTKYQVAGSYGASQCASVTATSCTITVDAAKPPKATGLNWQFKVRAFNGTKAGPYSAFVPVHFGKPTIPTNVSAAPRNGTAVVAWTVSQGSKFPVTGYTVTASNGNTCLTATNGCTVTGLTNGTTYTFTVTATNAVGTTSPSLPSAPIIVGAPRPPIVLLATAGPYSADVSFTAANNNGSPISYYIITAHDLTNPSDPSNGFQWSGPGSPIHIPSLTAGHTYNFTVSAVNGRGRGPESDPSTLVTLANVPDAPTGLVATAAAYSASVSFTAPADNGSPISFYVVTAYDLTNPSDPSHLSQWSGSSSPVSKPSLTAGHTYAFTVSASNGIGQGPESAPSNQVTIPLPPDAPTGLVAVAAVGSADISFTLPSDNGSPIGYYIITAHDLTVPGLTPQWSGSGSPIHQPFLLPGHDYVFTISAVNGVGQGPESAPSNQVTVL